jgi:ACT domain-containing protein
MTPNEILLAIFAPIIALAIFIYNLIQRLATAENDIKNIKDCLDPDDAARLVRLETKMDIVLQWIAALNGEMSDKKEFKEFLEQLKEVAKGKGL